MVLRNGHIPYFLVANFKQGGTPLKAKKMHACPFRACTHLCWRHGSEEPCCDTNLIPVASSTAIMEITPCFVHFSLFSLLSLSLPELRCGSAFLTLIST